MIRLTVAQRNKTLLQLLFIQDQAWIRDLGCSCISRTRYETDPQDKNFNYYLGTKYSAVDSSTFNGYFQKLSKLYFFYYYFSSNSQIHKTFKNFPRTVGTLDLSAELHKNTPLQKNKSLISHSQIVSSALWGLTERVQCILRDVYSSVRASKCHGALSPSTVRTGAVMTVIQESVHLVQGPLQGYWVTLLLSRSFS